MSEDKRVQVFFCNACGARLEIRWDRLIGRDVKVCSVECLREIELRRVRSIMGRD